MCPDQTFVQLFMSFLREESDPGDSVARKPGVPSLLGPAPPHHQQLLGPASPHHHTPASTGLLMKSLNPPPVIRNSSLPSTSPAQKPAAAGLVTNTVSPFLPSVSQLQATASTSHIKPLPSDVKTAFSAPQPLADNMGSGLTGPVKSAKSVPPLQYGFLGPPQSPGQGNPSTDPLKTSFVNPLAGLSMPASQVPVASVQAYQIQDV